MGRCCVDGEMLKVEPFHLWCTLACPDWIFIPTRCNYFCSFRLFETVFLGTTGYMELANRHPFFSPPRGFKFPHSRQTATCVTFNHIYRWVYKWSIWFLLFQSPSCITHLVIYYGKSENRVHKTEIKSDNLMTSYCNALSFSISYLTTQLHWNFRMFILIFAKGFSWHIKNWELSNKIILLFCWITR